MLFAQTKTLAKTAILFGAFLTAHGANAQDSGKFVHTFYLDTTGGISTHKSEMANSNDTGSIVGVEFGVWAGSRRNLGVSLRQEQATIAFELNEATKTYAHQDVIFRYRFSFMPIYIGGGISNSTWGASRTDDDDPDTTMTGTTVEPYLNMTTKGYAGNFGAFIPIGKSSTIFLDAMSVSPNAIQASIVERSDSTFTTEDVSLAMSSRTDVNFGASLKITKKMLDFLVGYKMTTYTMTIKDETYAEQDTLTYIGLRTGWTF